MYRCTQNAQRHAQCLVPLAHSHLQEPYRWGPVQSGLAGTPSGLAAPPPLVRRCICPGGLPPGCQSPAEDTAALAGKPKKRRCNAAHHCAAGAHRIVQNHVRVEAAKGGIQSLLKLRQVFCRHSRLCRLGCGVFAVWNAQLSASQTSYWLSSGRRVTLRQCLPAVAPSSLVPDFSATSVSIAFWAILSPGQRSQL